MRYLSILLIIIFISTCSNEPSVIAPEKAYSGLGVNHVYVVSHGWHTSLIIPSMYAISGIPELAERFTGTSYIEFGWGDKGFYQAKEITTGLALKAMLIPTESVVHAVGIYKNVFEFFPVSDIEMLPLTEDEIVLLMQFISGSFARDNQNLLIPTQLGLYGDSQFYKGVGDYYLTNTCNKWTAKGLSSFGLDISTTFKLTADSVMDYVKAHNKTTQVKQLN